ncbi:MAG: hypothetical protein WBP41_04240 [Saprospiraceae bacterium]
MADSPVEPPLPIALVVSTNCMISYRITKYNPKKRNSEGVYLDNSEWISVSDIGKPEHNNLTYEEYVVIETAYVNSVLIILSELQLETLIIDSLHIHSSKNDFKQYITTGRLQNIDINFDKEIKPLKNGVKLNISQLDKIIRLILRETLGMILINKNIEVIFGFDYYMYVKCTKLNDKTINKIEALGLFVEPQVERRKFIITDNDGNVM